MGIFFVYIPEVVSLSGGILFILPIIAESRNVSSFQPGGATEHSVVIVPFTIGRGNRRGADRSSSNHDDFRTVADAGRYDEHG